MATKSQPARDKASPSLEPRPAESAEAYVRALIAHGVECLFMNPGTDTIPIQEALSKLEQLGEPVPRTVLCLFELVALAAAHGYYQATGRPQAVLVHVDVGTQNLGGMLHNAQRGRAAVLIAAGRTPYTTDSSQRGTRDTYIHWLQEQFDQHGIVRNFVKWDYELRRPEQMGEVIARALQIAASDPPGPVYLTLPREVLMTEVGDVKQPAPELTAPARLGAGDPDALRDVAQHLVRSERPVVLTSTSGRTRQGFEALVKLATLLALPVVERRERTNFPTSHPLHQGFQPGPFVETADVILVVDSDVPYIPTQVTPRSDATIVQIDVDPIKERIPLWSFPLTSAIRADSARALELVAGYAAELLTDGDKARIETRRAELTARHNERRAARKASAQAMQNTRPLTAEWLGYCIGQLQREAPECVFVDESLTSHVAVWNHVDTDEPETMYRERWVVTGLGTGRGSRHQARAPRPSGRARRRRWIVHLRRTARGDLGQSDESGAHTGDRVQQRRLQREQSAADQRVSEGLLRAGASLRRHRPRAVATLRFAGSRRRRCWRTGRRSRRSAACIASRSRARASRTVGDPGRHPRARITVTGSDPVTQFSSGGRET